MYKVPSVIKLCVVAAMIAALPVISARAEVGVVIPPSGLPISYIFQIIVDEGEPVGWTWTVHHVGNPSYVTLNDQGLANGDHDPSLIMRSEYGFPIAAWAASTPQGYDVVVSRFDGTAWLPVQIVADSPADELDPYLVFNPDDDSVHLLYWINDGAPRVMHRQASSELSSWSTPVQVSQTGDIACRPSGTFHDGVLHISYEVHDFGLGSAPRQIVHATQNGQTFFWEIVATTQFPDSNWPRIHSADERLWIDWIDGEEDMAWTRRLAAGPWESIQTEHFETTEQRDFHIRGVIRIHALE